jgi:hypothetical protein
LDGLRGESSIAELRRREGIAESLYLGCYPPEALPDAMSHKDLAALGRDAGVKTLVASHVTARVSRDDVRQRVIAEMAEIYKGILIWGEDLMEIVIGEG